MRMLGRQAVFDGDNLDAGLAAEAETNR